MDVNDNRWGSYIPWFLRHTENTLSAGNLRVCFARFSQRFGRLFAYNEGEIQNLAHFGAWLESETLQRYRHPPGASIATQIEEFFEPKIIENLAVYRRSSDPEERAAEQEKIKLKLSKLSYGPVVHSTGTISAIAVADRTRHERQEMHFRQIAVERFGVAEAILRMLPEPARIRDSLCADLRKYFAESAVPLTIRGSPALIVPLEEPLFEVGVIQKLLPSLETNFPERARELIALYHDTIAGAKTLDSVFSEGFKTLEELARTITGDRNFMFDKSGLNKYFPALHGATRQTIILLAGQRGDVGAHGRAAPGEHEIRYLLFSICNIALLLIEQSRQDKTST